MIIAHILIKFMIDSLLKKKKNPIFTTKIARIVCSPHWINNALSSFPKLKSFIKFSYVREEIHATVFILFIFLSSCFTFSYIRYS